MFQVLKQEVSCLGSRRQAHPARLLGIPYHLNEMLREALIRLRLRQRSTLRRIQKKSRHAHIRGNNRQAKSHGFNDDFAETLLPGATDEQISATVSLHESFASQPAMENH